jgi:hypothetical protein
MPGDSPVIDTPMVALVVVPLILLIGAGIVVEVVVVIGGVETAAAVAPDVDDAGCNM